MKIYIGIDVPDNFERRLDMQPLIEAEIKADRWSWHTDIPEPEKEPDNVVQFPGYTSEQLDPDTVLENNKGRFSNMLLIGEDLDGDYLFCSNTPDREKLLMIVEQFKLSLLLGDFGD